MADNKGFLQFDLSEIEGLATAFAETSFSFNGLEKEAQKIIETSNLEQYTSQGVYGEKYGFPKWEDLKASTLAQKDRLGFGSKQKLERTGKLGDALINSTVTVSNNGFGLEATFKGEHAFLIPIFQKRFPLVIVTEPELEQLGTIALDNFVSNFSKRLGSKKNR